MALIPEKNGNGGTMGRATFVSEGYVMQPRINHRRADVAWNRPPQTRTPRSPSGALALAATVTRLSARTSPTSPSSLASCTCYTVLFSQFWGTEVDLKC